MTREQRQVGRNEHDARAANELVSVEGEQANQALGEALAVLCECGDATCDLPISMRGTDYEEIRAHPAQFAVLHGHEIPEAERVVATREGYLIVEKFGDAGRVALAGDPRNHERTCRVVLVDDVPEIRYLLKMLLATEPSCTVVGEAGTGQAALDVVADLKPELVVLDLEMPGIDGWHALPVIRHTSPTTHVIVFSSSEMDARIRKRLANLGANEVVCKGGDPSIIMAAIRRVAHGGRDRTFDADAPDAREDPTALHGTTRTGG